MIPDTTSPETVSVTSPPSLTGRERGAGSDMTGVVRPVRLRLSRAKGFDLQAHSRAVNGLEAVKVDRSTKWGNPYLLDDPHQWWSRHPFGSRERAQACVGHYERAIADGFVLVPYTALTPEERGDKYHSSGAHYVREVAPKYLGGRNIACWCALTDRHGDYMPCHADVLLSLANGITCEEVRDENLRRAKREAAR